MEEYYTNFHNIDPTFNKLYEPFHNIVSASAAFFIFQLVVLILLAVIYWIRMSGKQIKWIMVIVGLLYIVELQHIIETIQQKHYYPGLITSFALIGLGAVYWVKLYKELKKHD